MRDFMIKKFCFLKVRCPENKCEEGYSLIGITDVTIDIKREPLIKILDSRLDDIFIFRNCSIAGSIYKYKKSVSIGSN